MLHPEEGGRLIVTRVLLRHSLSAGQIAGKSNHFITFSETPQMVEIKGGDLVEKVRYCETFAEAANTNIQKVYELILSAAVKNGLPQRDLPETLYFISDMEFDCCTCGASLTNFEYAKKLFEEHGYHLPAVVFWNVQSRNSQQPVRKNEEGVILVSGCTPPPLLHGGRWPAGACRLHAGGAAE